MKANTKAVISRKALSRTALSVGITMALAACGGSGGSGDSATPSSPPASPVTSPPVPTAVSKTTVGTITGFGSVYVNGVRYDTSSARYSVDDDDSVVDDRALAVGMVVKIEGAVSEDEQSGVADDIYYDDELEGPISGLTTSADDASIKTFIVLGVTVMIIDSKTNFDSEDDTRFDFDRIANGDWVEISGVYDGDILVASYIEKQDDADDDVETRGVVADYAGASSFTLIQENGVSLAITLADGADIPDDGIANGQYVEVEGTIPDPVNAPDTILATEVELEDDDWIDEDDDDDVDIEGPLDFDPNSGTWSVYGVELAFDSSTEYEPESLASRIEDGSADGLDVEVEGTYQDGILFVESIEFEGEELAFEGDVEVISNAGPRDGTLRMTFGAAAGSVDILVESDTVFLNDSMDSPFNLDTITANSPLEVKAYLTDDNQLVASYISREDGGDYEIEAPVDAIDDVSITVAGISFGLDGDTEFDDSVPTVGDAVWPAGRRT